MRVLILSQFFYPEMGAPAARFLDFSRYFLRHGHEVLVLTGFPNFPSGRIHDGYRGKLFMRENVEGIQVYRTWLHASERLGFANKALGYASFTASSIVGAATQLPDFDVMIATAPPPTIGAAAFAISKGRQVPLVYDLRDLWPEAIVNSGRLKNPALIRGFEAINHAAYKQASAITTVSNGKRDALMESGVPREKIHVIPNGVALDTFDANAARNETEVRDILAHHRVPEHAFKITYAGIMNPPQGLEILISTAKSLSRSHPLVHFVLVGNGSCREQLERDASQLNNVSIIPEQPRERIPAFLSLSDANIVPLRPRKDTHTVPSKIFEYMASGRPLLLSADGEPQEIMKAASGGLFSSAGDENGLLNNITRMVQQPALRCAAGENARAFVEGHYNRRELNRRFLQLLSEVVERGPSS